MSDEHFPQGTPKEELPLVFVCGDCVHCQPGPNTKNNVLSRSCFRNPPTAVAILTQQGIAVMSVRPEVNADTPACGEYETDEDV